MKKLLNVLIVFSLVISTLSYKVEARTIPSDETKIETTVPYTEGNVVAGERAEFGIGPRTFYRDFNVSSGIEDTSRTGKLFWFNDAFKVYDKEKISRDIIVERVYDETDGLGNRNRTSNAYRTYKITYFPETGIIDYTGIGPYEFENLNMGFGISKDLKLTRASIRISFNSDGDNTIKEYVFDSSSFEGDNSFRSQDTINKNGPNSLYPGIAFARFLQNKNDEDFRKAFFYGSDINSRPVRAIGLGAGMSEDNKIKSWFASNITKDNANDDGVFRRSDIGSAVTWQTGIDNRSSKKFKAKYEVTIDLAVINDSFANDTFSGIVAGYSSWQNSMLFIGGEMNGYQKENRQAETIKVVYREHFDSLTNQNISDRTVNFTKDKIGSDDFRSQNVFTIRNSNNSVTEKKYTETVLGLTTPVSSWSGIDENEYARHMQFTPSRVIGYNLRNINGKPYKISTEKEGSTKVIKVDVYYDADIVSGKNSSGYEVTKPSDDYVTVQYFRGAHGRFQNDKNELNSFYVKRNSSRIKYLDAPTVTPNEGYIFSHWSIFGDRSNSKIDPNMPISEDLNIVANYSSEITTEKPNEDIISQYATVTFEDGANGRISAGTKKVWVLKTANKKFSEVRTEAGIKVTANPGYTHSGWTVGDSESITDNKTATAQYTPKENSKTPSIDEPVHSGSTSFVVRVPEGNKDNLKVKVNENPVDPSKITDNGDGSYTVTVDEPLENGNTITATYEEPDKNPSSAKVTVTDRGISTKPELEGKVYTGDSSFKVRIPGGNKNGITVTIGDQPVNPDNIVDNGDGTFTINVDEPLTKDTNITIVYTDGDKTPSSTTTTVTDRENSKTPSIDEPVHSGSTSFVVRVPEGNKDNLKDNLNRTDVQKLPDTGSDSLVSVYGIIILLLSTVFISLSLRSKKD